MKKITPFLAAIAVLIGAASTAEARDFHRHGQRYVKYHTSCGCPVYYERYVAFYDSCGHPVVRTRAVPVAHRCRPVVRRQHHYHADRCEPAYQRPVVRSRHARPIRLPIPVPPWH